jgi:hypothetical protein
MATPLTILLNAAKVVVEADEAVEAAAVEAAAVEAAVSDAIAADFNSIPDRIAAPAALAVLHRT